MSTGEEFLETSTPGAPSVPSKRKTLLRDVLETVFLALLIFGGINLVSARARVESVSMEPTLFRDDLLFVNRFAYRLGAPARGDIVVFHYPQNPKVRYIKRIIGLPGESVRIADGRVFINDVPLSEPYIKAPPIYIDEIKVPLGSLYVLGDNRNRSNDSHVWGLLPFDLVIGKALFIYWPTNRIGVPFGVTEPSP